MLKEFRSPGSSACFALSYAGPSLVEKSSSQKKSGARFNRFYTQSRDPHAEVGENLNPFLHRVWRGDHGIAAAIT